MIAPAMMLRELIKDLPIEVKGSKSVRIQGLVFDSRICFPGALFIAKRGSSFDGTLFISQAIAAGASVILTDLYDPFLKGVVQLIHPHPEEVEAILAARFYRAPSKELFVFGVTGTNGKTTTATLVKHLLDSLGRSCGLITTVETVAGERRFKSTLTTHDVIFNQKMLREMRDKGNRAASIEVSSHGLVQGRVKEIDFDVCLFTNLTPDHLDYHKDMEEYAAAKGLLFELLEKSGKEKKCAIANGDDPISQQILIKYRGPRILFGFSEKNELYADALQFAPSGTEFTVHARGASVRFSVPLIGRVNVYNLLGAIAVGLHLGSSLKEMAEIFSRARSAPGRLDRVPNERGMNLFVDHAHTEDALDAALKTLRSIAKGRVIVVFGAGGGRDKGRRQGLARAAERGADLAIVTTDNPRQEDPEEICRQILSGFASRSQVRVELDRRKAIELAIQAANPDDLVLIAGKGHETTQIFARETISFDDRAVALELLR